MQVLYGELAVLDIKMRNMILNWVLVPLQISTIKPVNKAQCRKKKQILVHTGTCAMCPCWFLVPKPRA